MFRGLACGRGYDFQDTIRPGCAADAGGRLQRGVGAAGRRADGAGGRKSADAAAETAAPRRRYDADIKDLELDWSQLNVDASTLTTGPASKARLPPQAGAGSEMSWSSKDKPNGSAAVGEAAVVAVLGYPDRRRHDRRPAAHADDVGAAVGKSRQRRQRCRNPPGPAWAAITAPGVGSIWDKTAVEARVDPAQEQSKLGTSLSKSLPLSEQYSLTLQNGYNVIQQGIVPVPGIVARPARNYETEQSAKLSIADTGTSFIAGQTLSSTDDKWLRKIGAEQKLFDGVSISGSIGETPQGTTNKSLTAGFKRSW